jgi:SAM-dependent methyltransferase
MAGYTEDLAYIHDAGYGDFARNAAPVLLETFRARGIHGGLVVDLGCGSGIWAHELIAAGYDVVGVDISPSMIRLARRRAPQARFVTASLLRFALPACDAVTSIGECVNYAFDPGSNREALARLFGRVYDALRPGGVFAFDFAEPGQIPGAASRRKYAVGPDWAVLVDATEDKRRGILVRRMVSFRKLGKLYRRTEETHTARLYKGSDLLAELRSVGFRARLFRRYGSMRLRAACARIVAVKTGGRI